jgi:thymidylate kinase
MFIIVEGPDGAGKTTLINKLKEQFENDYSSCEVVHFGKIDNPDEYFRIYLEAIMNQVDQCVSVSIFDRCWYSDRVYGPVMRNAEEMTFDQARNLDQHVIERGGGMIIYCDAPIDVLWSRCRERGESYITDVDQLEQIAMLYKVEIKQSLLPVVYYNTALGF